MRYVLNASQCDCPSYHVFFLKQETAYELLISDWSSDVCSSDLFGSSPRPGRIRRISPLPITVPAGRSRMKYTDRRKTLLPRSDERLVGQECGRTCRSRWSPYH